MYSYFQTYIIINTITYMWTYRDSVKNKHIQTDLHTDRQLS